MKIGQDVIGKRRTFTMTEHYRPYGKWLELTIKDLQVVYELEHLDLSKQIYELPYGYDASIFTDGASIYIVRSGAHVISTKTKAKRISELTAGMWTFKQHDKQKVLDFRNYGRVFPGGVFSRLYKAGVRHDPEVLRFPSRRQLSPIPPHKWWEEFIGKRAMYSEYIDKDTYELLHMMSKQDLTVFYENVPPETPNHEMRAILKAMETIL